MENKNQNPETGTESIGVTEMQNKINYCCICGKECYKENDCWVCPDENCSIHKEEN